MSLRDEIKLRPEEEEDFSDITEFRPEGDAFRRKGPLPMQEDRSIHGVQRPWVILLLIGIALLLAGGTLFFFSMLTNHQRTRVSEADSLIPESRFHGNTETSNRETEVTSVTIPVKTKTSEKSASETENEPSESGTEESNSEESTERPVSEPEETEKDSSESTEENPEKTDPVIVEADGCRCRLDTEHGEATLLKYIGDNKAAILPETIESYPLAGIDDEAFMGLAELEVVELSDSVCWIGARAFSGCVNLSEVYITENVNAISDEAFSGAEHIIIVAPEGSYAAAYAAEKGISYKPW